MNIYQLDDIPEHLKRFFAPAPQIGMEPTPEEYVANLVLIMAGVGRALKDDGLLWLNLGDSYNSKASWGRGQESSTLKGGKSRTWRSGAGRADGIIDERGQRNRDGVHCDGLKIKDLIIIPARVALAMQKAGWYLRSMIPWIKRNPMPESVTDRPSTAVEYVFMFSKQAKYYYNNHEVVRIPYSDSFLNDRRHITGPTEENEKDGYEQAGATNPKKLHRMFNKSDNKYQQSGLRRLEDMERIHYRAVGDGRNRRNSDWFFESWQGLLGDDDGDPMAMVVNTHGFNGAHFATFPERLVQPMILASTNPGDVVLDPFFGAGTTGLVALKLGRKCIGIELNPEFAKMAEQRCSSELTPHIL